MTEAILLLGGNEGDVPKTFAMARALIAERVGRIVRASQCYESKAWGFEATHLFSDQAVAVETELAPLQLLDALQAIEAALGRDRLAEMAEKERSGQRYVSRKIDIDILFYGDETVENERLAVPHPLLAEREFALVPLAEIAPARRHPITGLTAGEMLEKLKKLKIKNG